MNLIVRHIEYLMMDHDCVVVPGLGAFLAHWHEAAYDFDTEVFSSPRRDYAFNNELIASDGLMIMSVARALDIDTREAAVRIEQGVEAIRRELDMSGMAIIGHLGHLVKNNDGNIIFKSAAADMITPMISWMPRITTIPAGSIRRQRDMAMAERVRSARPGRFMRYVRTAVGAVAAILIALVASTPIAVENAYEASTKLPAITMPRHVEVDADDDIIETRQKNSTTDNYQAVEADNVVEAVNTDVTDISTVEKSTTDAAVKDDINHQVMFNFNELDEYVVVVASLVNDDEVDRFIEQQRKINKSIRFGVIKSSRYHRVYVATGSTKDQAQAQSRLVRNKFEGAWVTRR